MVDWGDVPTWVTAGTALAALVAAFLAYRAQSDAARKQAQQVDLQGRQLDLQAQVIADQIRLQERQQADQVDVAGRPTDGAQAAVLPPDKGEPVHMVVVTNGSTRPIREVACKIEVIGADPSIRHDKQADVYGLMMPYALGPAAQAETFVFGERTGTIPVLRAGQKAAFVWSFTVALYPRFSVWLRFTDDAGLHWEITTDLHLQKLAKRDW
jgi:hypothetical protein